MPQRPDSKLPFIKMHGLGNDFIILDLRSGHLRPDSEALRVLADRRQGIGCDQIMLLSASSSGADIWLDMVNADGSVAGACGNGTRCVAWLLMQETAKDRVEIDTISGRLSAWINETGLISVNMGPARLDWQDIPLANAQDTLDVSFDEMPFGTAVCVNMGNPHAVFFVDDADQIDVARWGAFFESHDMFPQKANIEFVSQIADNHLRMRVYERGAGITLACGSGACAAGVAAIRRNLATGPVIITLDGGELVIDWQQTEAGQPDSVIITGEVSLVAEGQIDSGFMTAARAVREGG